MVQNSSQNPHRWPKGRSGNPKGRPKIPTIELLNKAMQEVEAEKRKGLFKHAVERAYSSDSVLVALIKKLVPDLQNMKVDGNLTLKELMAAVTKDEAPVDEVQGDDV